MTATEMGFREVDRPRINYYNAGLIASGVDKDTATDCFDNLARTHGVISGPYGSWDQFWMGYFHG